MSGWDRSACRLPERELHTTGATTGAPNARLRHLKRVLFTKELADRRHKNSVKSALGCSSRFLPHRYFSQNFAPLTRRERLTA
jgi:hypothetical protein